MTIETITERYEAGRMTKALLGIYVKKGVVTSAQYKTITGEDYVGPTPSGDNDEILNILLGEEA